MINKHLFSIFILVLFMAYTDATNAQTEFVQSRFLGEPFSTICSACDPADGIVHVRFKPEATKLINSSSANHVEFTLQIRKAGGIDLAIVVAQFRLAFDTAVFGENLNTPPVATGNNVNPAGQCSFVRAETFIMGTRNYSISFVDSRPNELFINERSGFAFFNDVRVATPASFAFFAEEWQDMVTMRCMIPSGMESSEAGFAVSGSLPQGFFGGRFPTAGNRVDRSMMLLVDNDLRGFRLDGKTWAEDYSRYGDGTGVRVKFSKGISTELAANNFVLELPLYTTYSSTPTIYSVDHTAGSRYATIIFDRAVNEGVVRLVSTTPTASIVMDMDNEVLADDSFVAALHYDAEAPVVMDVGQVNTATWSLTFDKPIHPATVSKENLCLTNEMGVCADEVQGTRITSVRLMREDNKVLQVEISSAEQTERIAAIEFRRNAMLGADFRVVEEYQVELRDAITIADGVPLIPDIIPPVIRVDEVSASPLNRNNKIYSVVFSISSNEDIVGLASTASYKIVRCLNENCTTRDTTTYTPSNISSANPATGFSFARSISAEITLNNLEDIQATWGFVLLRASAGVLQDAAGNDPVNTNEETIAANNILGLVSEGAIARRDRTSPQISLRVRQVRRIGDSDTYELVFRVNRPEAKSIPTQYEGASYRLIRVSDTDVRTDITDAVTSFRIEQISIPGPNPAELTYRVTVPDSELGSTKGFMLARFQDDDLLDNFSNLPVRAEDGALIGTGTNGLLRSTLAIIRLPSSDADLMSLEIASAGTNENIPLLPNGFSSAKTDYTAEVRGDRQILVTATPTHPQATIQIAKGAIAENTPSFSDELASATIDLNLKTTTTVIIRVIAEDSITMKDYAIALTRLPNAQTEFVQSRFLGEPFSTICSACDPADGIVHVRFKPEATKLINSSSANHVEFTLQIRKAGGIDLAIVVAQFRLAFDTAVFGENLNTPPVATGNNVNPAGQCSFVRAETFTMGTRNYSISFIDSFPNELSITEQSGFAVFNDVRVATPASFAFFAEEWQDMVTMRCMIPSGMESSEAGFAVSGSQPQGFFGGRFPQDANGQFLTDGDRDDRTMMLLVDNDLRGFRLDGKTWAEDYSRYGDGTGVRVKFSKGISTELAANNFVLELPLYATYSSTPTIYSVDHTAGSRYATIIFDRAVNEGVVRLVSTTPTASIVMDMDNEVLADDSFVAALHYDAEAPVVMDVGQVNTATWSLTFDKPIHPAAVSKENLCLTNEMGVCADEVQGTRITSVRLMGEDNKVLQVEISSAEQTERIAAIEFRRNAMLGEDFRVVEEYQVELRDAITIADGVPLIPDIIPPTIRITRSETLPQTQNNKIYDVNFVIQSNENIPDIASTASYKIVRCLNENCTTRDTTTYTPSNISSANPATGFSFARSISAEITLNNLEDIQATWGFVLLRASAGVLQDAAGNDPVNTNEETIAADGILGVGEGAIARRDRTSPQISLSVRQVRRIGDSDTYELVFRVNRPEAKTIPTLYEGASYRLIRVSDTDVRTDITDAATSFRIEQISISGPNPAELTYSVTVTDSELGSIKGFMVARAEADDLLDNFSNLPMRAEDGALIGTGTDGLLRSTLAIIRVSEADATLETLTIGGESVAGFDPAIAEYTVEVEGNLAIDLIAKATHDQAMIQIAGTSGVGQVSTRTQLNLATTTTIVVEVTSEDGENTREYTVAVKRLPSADASLANIGIIGTVSRQSIDLLPAGFASTRTDYTAVVSDDLNVTINAEVMHPQAMIQIAKGAIAENTPSSSDELASTTIDLNLKTTTTVVIRVIAEDGITMQDYTIALTRLPDENATLETLTIGGESVAGFDPAIAEYTVEVEGNLAIDLIAKATHDQAMIQIAGTSGVGQVSTRTQLNLATTTTIVVEVTSEDGENTREYTVAVKRLPSADASLANIGIIGTVSRQSIDLLPAGFASTRTDYTAVVSDDLNVTINAEVMHPQATIQIAKGAIAENTPSSSDELASTTIDLNLKTTTTVVIRVIAEDGITMQDYTIALTRLPDENATLEALTIGGELIADFNPATARYTVEVEGDIAIDIGATATHDQAMIQIAGISGVGQVSTRTQLNLRSTTIIVVEVTSEDGKNTRAYTIAIIRLPSSDADLMSLEIASAGTNENIPLLPNGFSSAKTDYTAEVRGDRQILVTATPTHPQATIQIAKEAIAENTPSFSDELASATIDLNLKTTTTVIIRVIAEDSITMKDYAIALTRLPNAQTEFVQSRFLGEPFSTICSACDPADGIVHVRFKPEATKLINSSSANHVEFTLQIRKAGGIDLAIVVAQFRLAFDTAVFGENLNTPPVATGNNVNPAGQCSFVRAETFTMGTRNYSIFFGDSRPNELSINEQSGFAVFNDVRVATPASFAFFAEEWQDMVTMRCMIPSGMESSEAGFAVSGSQPQGFFGGRFPQDANGQFLTDGDRDDRTMMLLVDNDLRGFRLDGKTWAEDYSRYGDGTGVRVKFSKGISTELAANNFVLELPLYTTYSSTPTIYSVDHTAGSRYATIIFDRAVNEGVVRLVSTTPTASIVMDMDNEVLADDSFAAALHYDAEAPVVMDVGQVNTATWSLTFDKPIHPAAVSKENLCLTNEMGVCADEVQGTRITSVRLMGEDNKVLQVEISSAEQTERIAAIEFRRNAMLGEDFRVVEEYQVELRDAITIADGVPLIPDIIPPTIRITRSETLPQTQNNKIYDVNFVIQSNENIPDIASTASYKIVRCLNADCAMRDATTYTPSNITATGFQSASISAEITLNNLEDIQATWGFVLLRASAGVLQDAAGNDPVNTNGGDDSRK